MIVFIIETVATMVVFLTLFGIFIWWPLNLLSRWSRLLVYYCSFKRVNWFLRAEQVRMGIELPIGHPEMFYDEDVQFRRQRDRAAGS